MNRSRREHRITEDTMADTKTFHRAEVGEVEGFLVGHGVLGNPVLLGAVACLARMRHLVGVADRRRTGLLHRGPGAARDAGACSGPQPAATARFAAVTIFSTLGRYFISSLNSGMCVS